MKAHPDGFPSINFLTEFNLTNLPNLSTNWSFSPEYFDDFSSLIGNVGDRIELAEDSLVELQKENEFSNKISIFGLKNCSIFGFVDGIILP